MPDFTVIIVSTVLLCVIMHYIQLISGLWFTATYVLLSHNICTYEKVKIIQ